MICLSQEVLKKLCIIMISRQESMNKCTNLRISLRELSDITNNKFSSVIYDYVAFGNGNMVIFDVEAKKVLFEDKKHAKDTDVSILATIEHHK
jgi:hypothetical protein